jgi:hypothetical protein
MPPVNPSPHSIFGGEQRDEHSGGRTVVAAVGRFFPVAAYNTPVTLAGVKFGVELGDHVCDIAMRRSHETMILGCGAYVPDYRAFAVLLMVTDPQLR